MTETVAGRTTGATVLRGGAWHTASQVVPQAFTLVISVAAARYLGPDGLGRQSFIAFVALSATALLSGGLYQGLSRFVGESLGKGRPGAVRDLARWAGRLQVAVGALGGAAVALPGLLGSEPELAWGLAGLGTALSVVATTPTSVLAGAQRWREVSIVGLVTGFLAVPATIVVLAAGGGISGMFAVETAAIAAGLVVARRARIRLLREIAPGRTKERGPRRATARFSALSTIAVLTGLVIWKRSEFLFLAAYSTDAQIAFLLDRVRRGGGAVLLPDAIAAVLAPAFATLHGAGAADRIRSGYWRAQRLLLTVSLPLSAVLAALGPELIETVYGDDFEEAGSLFLILMTLFPLIPLRTVAGSLLIGLGLLRVRLATDVAAACVTIGLNFLLVPAYDATGAALANLGGQLALVLPLIVYGGLLQRPVQAGTGAIVKTVAASVAAGLAALGLLELLGGVGGLALGHWARWRRSRPSRPP